MAQSWHRIGGISNFTGKYATGGVPGFFGSTGGFAGGTGGVPALLGAGTVGYYPSGGAPGYVGRASSGGVQAASGGASGAPDAAVATGGNSPVLDAGAPDSGLPDYCTSGGAVCRTYCIRTGPVPDDASDCRPECGIPTTGLGSCSRFTIDGQNYLRCTPDCTGRRPPGLDPTTMLVDGALRAYFEEMSRLEAASVPAFRILARELRAHGAPRSLVRAARRAARDEVRHTRMGKRLAERFGGRYVPPRVEPRPLRTIEALAADNAVEGCVRETFGAMIATWQSRAASDRVVRRIMRRVAVDETRHAALALRVAAWADRKLDDAARQRVKQARRDAVAQVMRELAYRPSAALFSLAGVPTSDDARRLATVLDEQLWS